MNILKYRWLPIGFVCVLFLSLAGTAQEAPSRSGTVSVRFDTPQYVLMLATNVEEVGEWSGHIIANLEGPIPRELYARKDFYLLVQITLYPNQPATFRLAGNPQPGPEARGKIQNMLNQFPPPKMKKFPVTISFSLVGGSAKEQMDLLLPPDVEAEKHFMAAGGAERVKLLRQWSREQALAVIGAHCSNADSTFKGVVRMGDIFTRAASNKKTLDTDAVDRDEAYWLSVIEMAPGTPMTAAGRIFMDSANGRFDRAGIMARFILQFTDKDCVAYNYLHALLGQLDLVKKDQAKKIKTIAALIDQERFKEALAAIHQTLAIYPHSAEAYHEQALIYMRQKDPRFAAAQKKIFQCNPLYMMRLNAETGRDAYRMGRRLKIKELFQDSDQHVADMMTLGHIALDLDEPQIAATHFWHLSLINYEQTADALNYFLYSMEKAGVGGLKKNFDGQWTTLFKNIDQQRQKAMEEDIYYKSMIRK